MLRLIGVYSALVLGCSVLFLTGCGGGGGEAKKEFEEIVLTPAGGEFDLAWGGHLSVPSGAVDSDTPIQMRRIEPKELKDLFEAREVPMEDLYGAIQAKPDGTTFNEPIAITFSAEVEPGDFPVVFAYDLETGYAGVELAGAMIDPDKDEVTLYMSHFTDNGVENRRQKEDEFAKKYCEEYPCRCKGIKTKTESKSVMCKDPESSCEMSEVKTRVEFLDCDSIHEDTQLFIDARCMPKITLKAAKSSISTHDQTDISATVYLGCPSMTRENETVKFTHTGPGNLSESSMTTDANGVTKVTLSSDDEEGIATVKADTTVEFYESFQTISFQGVSQTTPGTKITRKAKQESTTVEIKDQATMTLTSDLQTLSTAQYATLNVEIKKGNTPSVDDQVLIEVEGLDVGSRYVIYPMMLPTTSGTGTASIQIQILSPGTHQVTVKCTPISFGFDDLEELSETVSLSVTKYVENWTGSLNILSPEPEISGIIVFGSININFSFAFSNADHEEVTDETVSVSQSLTVTNNDPDSIHVILEHDTPSSPDATMLLGVYNQFDEKGFFDPDSRTFTLGFSAEDVFYWYRYKSIATDVEGEWSMSNILVRTDGDPKINEFPLEPCNIQDNLLNCVNEGDPFTLTLSK